ncbi:M20/M25/M40 family metallo-hydrolase [Aliikangiella marina]|uniref:M20/M25/M40 family metallo-hydrolase n=1 Tax=Aliikangiella marina TaxID=1712262 RepID=A0A545TCE7_9GAMM|nr:M20/M25/M40 family metallo-hydrolase [Aliikangiella marina]TQV74889.1 M20/M25/M40 family metallo-hydrolase [Aliikangiella marina]
MVKIRFLVILTCLIGGGCANTRPPCNATLNLNHTINHQQLLSDLRTLSAAEMQGRKPTTEGSRLAQDYITSRFQQAGLETFAGTYRSHFKFRKGGSQIGTNLIGYKRGEEKPDEYIVLTAHYDHLGKKGRVIYYGADDNASGVSAILAIADYLKDKKTKHSVIFLATDAEEYGLFGSKAFVKNPPVQLSQIKLNLNFDMIGQGGASKLLYVAGTKKNPQLKPVVRQLQQSTSVCLQIGHEVRKKLRGTIMGGLDWQKASDHAPFSEKDIPYLYFGVDLHRHYHQQTDTFESIDQGFYMATTETLLDAFKRIDGQLQELLTQ